MFSFYLKTYNILSYIYISYHMIVAYLISTSRPCSCTPCFSASSMMHWRASTFFSSKKKALGPSWTTLIWTQYRATLSNPMHGISSAQFQPHLNVITPHDFSEHEKIRLLCSWHVLPAYILKHHGRPWRMMNKNAQFVLKTFKHILPRSPKNLAHPGSSSWLNYF